MQSAADPSLEDFPGYIRLTWEDIEMLVWETGMQLATQRVLLYDNIITLSRGGLVPTGLLTQFKSFAKCKVHVVKVSFYDENLPIPRQDKDTIMDLSLLGHNWQELNDSSTIILDDLWDTGKSLSRLTEVFPLATYATLLSKKPKKETFLSAVGMEADTNRWVVFPWEEVPERGSQTVRQSNKTKAKLAQPPLEGVTHIDYTNIQRMWDLGIPAPSIRISMRDAYGRDVTLETIRKVLNDGKP